MSESEPKDIFAKAREKWESNWSADDYSPGWLNRGIAPELVRELNAGNLPARGRVLDIGCGIGDTAAWFACRGYEVTAFDIAEAAIEKGRVKYGDLDGHLHLLTLDVCQEQIPGGPYDLVIDRGCLHQLPVEGQKVYADQLARVSSVDAKLALFILAYRKGRKIGDPEVRKGRVRQVGSVLSSVFAPEKIEDIFMDKDYGKGPSEPMPGMFFLLSRRPAGSASE